MIAEPIREASITAGFERCRPILVTISNSYFMVHCFARSHYLHNYEHPVYIEEFLSSTDRQSKKNLAKRYGYGTICRKTICRKLTRGHFVE